MECNLCHHYAVLIRIYDVQYREGETCLISSRTCKIMELLEDKLRVWLDSAKFVKPHSGVYVLYDRNKEPIFIGETDNMERTFTEYVDTEFSESECKQKTKFYQREFTDNQKERQLQLIEEFRKETGGTPVCNSEIKVETH